MIAGIGMDMIELARIERALQRFGIRFLARILSPAETDGIHGNRVAYIAGRFAAKEAGAKALGSGIRGGIGWRDIEILNLASGAPKIQYHGAAGRRLRAMGAAAHVTLTHTRQHAAAVVILEAQGVAGECCRQ